MNGSSIKRAAFLGRAQLPGGVPSENICFQVSAGLFQKLQVIYFLWFLVFFAFLGFLVFLVFLLYLSLMMKTCPPFNSSHEKDAKALILMIDG